MNRSVFTRAGRPAWVASPFYPLRQIQTVPNARLFLTLSGRSNCLGETVPSDQGGVGKAFGVYG